MAIEKFEDRSLTGNIKVTCKFQDGTVRLWQARKEDIIENIKEIVDSYGAQGYILTLRQLHYQLVTRNLIVNHDSAYKRLGGILDDCRYGGVIDWEAIEDRGRVPFIPYSVTDPDHALQDTIDQYRIDRQKGQKVNVELFTEKDALSGILRRVTSKYHIRLNVNKGYTSSTAIYNAYQRYVQYLKNGQKVTILYFGDHDPSGLDMVRDIKTRLHFFFFKGDAKEEELREKALDWAVTDRVDYENEGEEWKFTEAYLSWKNILLKAGLKEDDMSKYRWMYICFIRENFEVKHIGLTMEQIDQYDLPPNPTKFTDSRSKKYVDKYGKTCWEVDALRPDVLTSIVESHVKKLIDIKLFNEVVAEEQEGIETLEKFINK